MTLAGKQAVVPDSTSSTGLAAAKVVADSMCSSTTLRVGSPEVFATTTPGIRSSSAAAVCARSICCTALRVRPVAFRKRRCAVRTDNWWDSPRKTV